VSGPDQGGPAPARGSATANRKKGARPFSRVAQRAQVRSSASGAERSRTTTWIFVVDTVTGARRGAVARSLTGRSSSSNVRHVGATTPFRRRTVTPSRRWSATPAAQSRAFKLCRRVREQGGVHSSSGRPSGEKKSAPRRIAPGSSFKLTHNATILADSTSASRRESVI
jgi:hypothetical protein